MRPERSQNREALRGGLGLAVLVVLFFMIFFLADVRALFTRTDTLHVLMPSAEGLRPGSPVWVAGQTVGEVKEIEVRPPGTPTTHRVLVHIKIARRYREHIRRDSEARVTTFRVIGEPVLDITPGEPGTPPFQTNDTLPFRSQGSPRLAAERALALQASLTQVVEEAKALGRQTSNGTRMLSLLQDRLTVSAREMKALTLALQDGPLNTLSDPELHRMMSEIFRSVDELGSVFTQAAERARAARAEAAPALERLAARTDTISARIADLQQAMAASGGGLLTRAQSDSAIIKAMHGAQLQLDSLVAETKRNPLRFWF